MLEQVFNGVVLCAPFKYEILSNSVMCVITWLAGLTVVCSIRM